MSAHSRQAKSRPPAALFAPGLSELPAQVFADGWAYRYASLFKHDFFAATGLYERLDAAPPAASQVTENFPAAGPPNAAAPRFAVLKLQRTHPFCGFPMQWLGRLVASHEISIYQKLQGVPGIPRFLGRVGPTGFLHEFIPGTDLHADLPLTPEFFAALEKLFGDLHQRHIAYVDSNKRENILYGDDHRPWLIDFQISFHCKKGQRDNLLARLILRKMIHADWYHFYKHKTRLLPAACSPDDFQKAQRRGLLHQFHRLLARPLIRLRRVFLARYDLAKTR